MEPDRRERVVVALSGGVDSSVAAALLVAEGHDVVGVTLRLQRCQEAGASRSCCGVDGIARARAVSGQIGIPHYVLDCVDSFDATVLRPTWDEYAAGRTPSPCLLCNERIKFGTLLDWARAIGASSIATGHYARTDRDGAGLPILLRGCDPAKDQSYFLAGLTREQLGAVRFPLGSKRKDEVRELARSMELPSADAPDSQDACLVARGESFAEMLRKRFAAPAVPGSVITEDGTCLGQHQGIHLFTVGQRRGLPGPSHLKHWVTAVHAEDATVRVSADEHSLDGRRFRAIGMNWLDPVRCAPGGNCQVQVRYRHPPVAAWVEQTTPDVATVTLEEPVRAIAPGQAAVFYDGSRVLGRGWIQLHT